MAEVTMEEVTKIYGDDVTAVDKMNLDIPDGEFVVFVGPSGCGKSTALRMIAGLEDISGGKVFIGDRVVNDLPPRERDIAMVFQNYALYPHMNVRENMGFALKLRKMDKSQINSRVEEAARILSIEHFLDRKPKALSGGQRQRVALGRAIVREPKAFLMDEPLSNLDAKLRVQMRTEIAKLHNRIGTTTIYVTHDQTEAMTMADRIVVLKDGLVQQVATPQIMYDQPDNVFVAGFIGSPAMNFIRARLEKDGDGRGQGQGLRPRVLHGQGSDPRHQARAHRGRGHGGGRSHRRGRRLERHGGRAPGYREHGLREVPVLRDQRRAGRPPREPRRHDR
ncbi:MAG: Maltose/maltodextrin transport ATP-binding protein MalK [uncultured Microvirga sp.]|uniref:Maltose/maltodextrin transport ATP-binding protein MalK n=1 Tax=uncultured Microvirga sp. TaxID=412392 RepID=A0A6J4MPG3_9HYPH|nr:MAG: Maltose/maltodextrin transport ATP-binding protein MalK [uncultured Microvirga sp.]